MLIGDHIAIEPDGRIYGLGLYPQFAPVGADGMSTPHSVAAIIDVPSVWAGEQVPILLELRDVSLGQAVHFVPPGQTQPQAVRVQQLVVLTKPTLPGLHVPAEVPCRVQVKLDFPAGLCLPHGRRYQWRVEIAGRSSSHWGCEFQVLSPAPAPVIGGAFGGSGIPTVAGLF